LELGRQSKTNKKIENPYGLYEANETSKQGTLLSGAS